MQVQEIMTKNVLTVRPQTTVREVAELLVSHKISGLPVVDDAGKLVGIITNRDLRFVPPADFPNRKVHEVMTSMPLITPFSRAVRWAEPVSSAGMVVSQVMSP